MRTERFVARTTAASFGVDRLMTTRRKKQTKKKPNDAEDDGKRQYDTQCEDNVVCDVRGSYYIVFIVSDLEEYLIQENTNMYCVDFAIFVFISMTFHWP
jgi:hypothetical protein